MAGGVFEPSAFEPTAFYINTASYTLTSVSGTFTVAASNVAIAAGRQLPASAGAFSTTGYAETSTRAYNIHPVSAAYIVSGNPQTLTYSQVTIHYDGVSSALAAGVVQANRLGISISPSTSVSDMWIG